MANVNFLNQAESVMSENYISQLHSNVNKKIKSEGTLFRSDEEKNSGKELEKIEICCRKQKMNCLKKNVKTLKENLIIWSKYRRNIDKWILGKLTSLIF